MEIDFWIKEMNQTFQDKSIQKFELENTKDLHFC